MPKPSSVMNLKLRRPQPVSEEVARRLEAAAEAQGNGVAGARNRVPTTSPTAEVTAPAPNPANEVQVPEASPSPAPEPAAAQDSVEEPRYLRRVDQQPEVASPEAPAPISLPSRGSSGTMRAPHVRKSDGVKTRITSLHIPVDLGRELAVHCAMTDRKMNDVIVRAIRAYLSTTPGE